MSRVAKRPVVLPNNVEMNIDAGLVTVKGPKGSLSQHCNKLVSIQMTGEKEKTILFAVATNDPNAWAQAGTMRALVNNMVLGVTQGFEKTLELVGVGYRAQPKGKDISLSLGFSHPVEYVLPKGVTAEFPANTTIVLKSINKQLLGQVAAEIRSYRPPEPYKGKGVKYGNEIIKRKETKKK